MVHRDLATDAPRGMLALRRPRLLSDLFRAYVARPPHLSAAGFEARLYHGLRHLRLLREYGTGEEAFAGLELREGPYPVVPVALWLCGASVVWTCGAGPPLRAGHVRDVLRRFREYQESGLLPELLPGVVPERLVFLRAVFADRRLCTPRAILRHVGVRVLAKDVRSAGLPPGSVDLIASEGVIEHLPPDVLRGTLSELRRVARPGAVMSHGFEAAGPHPAADARLTPFDFGKSPGRGPVDGPPAATGRSPCSDYRSAIRGAGFEIVREESRPGPGEPPDHTRSSPRSQGRASTDLSVPRGWLAARLAAVPAGGTDGRQ